MKKFLFSFSFIATLLFDSTAQIAKGRTFVAGVLGFSVDQSKTQSSGTSIKTDPNYNFGFYPNVGHFVNDKIALGLGIGYLGSTANRGKVNIGLFGISPFARKYFPIGQSGNLYIFLQLSVDLGFGHSKTIMTDSTTGQTTSVKGKVNSFGFGIAPGFTLFTFKRLATEFTFGYIPYSVVERQNYLLGFTSSTRKPIPNPKDEKERFFGFGFGLRSIIATSLTFKIFLGPTPEKKEKKE